MLGKLIKYDFRSCWKKFRLLWAALLGLACISGVLMGGAGFFGGTVKASGGNSAAAGTVSIIVFSCFMCAAVVMSIMYVCDEFYNGLLGNRGYLMFSLPVKTKNLILSKGITAILMETISCFVAGLSIFLLVTCVNPAAMAGVIREVWVLVTKGHCLAELPKGSWLCILEGIVFFFTTAALFNSQIHASIAVGHLAKKNRAALALITYFAIDALGSFLLIKLSDCGVMRAIGRAISGAAKNSTLFHPDLAESMLYLLMFIVAEVIVTLIFYFVEKWILEHKLNLD